MSEVVLKDKLIEKSKEAFLLAIELYNKPTIRYRIEGFSMFICNAWELMLKAHMIETFGESSIYYPNNPDRTLALTDCIKKVFTNDKDPLRLNIEKIVELRNTSTHLITEEYEMVYIPLFQSCVLNYNDKMMEFHGIDITELVPQNFLTLSTSMKALSETEFAAKYPEAIVNRFMSLKNGIENIASATNEKFAININVNHYQTKNPKLADSVYRIAKEGEIPVALIKDVKDPSNVFRFTTSAAISTIKSMLRKNHVTLLYRGSATAFNNYHFINFVKHYGIKQNEKLCWAYKIYTNPQYTYSQQAIDFIYEELAKDPEHILDRIKQKNR